MSAKSPMTNQRALELQPTPRRLVATALLIAVTGCGPSADKGAASSGPRAMPVEMQIVGTDLVVEQVRAVGSLLANESVVLRSEIPGRIAEILFEEGQAVTKGQPLITLDAAEHQALVAQTSATVELANLSFERAKDLLQSSMISKQEFDEAQARLKESRAGLRRNQVVLRKTRLVAPFSATIGLRHVSPGAYIQPGQDLVNLEAIDPIKVELKVSERYASAIGLGQEIQVEVDAVPDGAFKGEIYAVDPKLDPQTRAFSIRAKVPNPDGILHPGMFARVALIVERRPGAITVPEEAIWPQGNGIFVYRVEAEQARLVPIAVGERFAGKVEVREGLSAGDMVVTSGHMKIRDGMKVVDIQQMRARAAGEKPS